MRDKLGRLCRSPKEIVLIRDAGSLEEASGKRGKHRYLPGELFRKDKSEQEKKGLRGKIGSLEAVQQSQKQPRLRLHSSTLA